jgi:mono/diheme cytochrome c family protein
MKFKLLGVLIIAGVAIQFVPYGKDHTNPPVVAEPKWDTQKTKETFYRVCGNCHSNTTTWPWYSTIAPVSWLVSRDVAEGREHFNVSMWGAQSVNKGRDAAEELREGEMPPWFYVIGHPEAKLSGSEKDEFVEGLSATFGGEKEK